MSSDHALHTFMAQVTEEMSSEYQRIYAKTAEDPGTAGDEGEENWASLLRDWLPPSYHVATKGRLIGVDGQMSPQIDVLVLKPFYPMKLRSKRTWLAGGVAAAFECKTTLKAEHITQSAERCKAFKSLYEPRTGTPHKELRSPLTYGILAHSHAWKAEGSDPAANITAALSRAETSFGHPREMIDLVCVSDVGSWSATATTFYQAEWIGSERAHLLEGLFGGAWGPTTAMIGSSLKTERQASHFQPVGSMLYSLTERLAREDPSIRDLADYYRKTAMPGSGQGTMRHWPQAVYSDDVRKQIEAGHSVNDGSWSEWSISLF